ncbi:MAG: HD-GYP domain-containing protein, partial [Candidatus Binatia bacterium]
MSSPQENPKSPAWAETFFLVMYRLIQTIRIHKDNNDLVKASLSHFKQTICKLDTENDLTILISEGRFYIQGEKLQFRQHLVRLINDLVDFFEQRELPGLRFHPKVRNASLGEILAFVRLLILSGEQRDSATWLSQKLGGPKFPWISIVQDEEIKQKSFDPDLRKRARTAYSHALGSLKQVAQKIHAQGYAGVRRSKRMVQSMVDVVVEDEAILLGLGTIKDYDDYTYSHSVNVAVLSLCLGNRIGLSRSSLEHLGICGLFHDLGKVEIPREIVTKPGELSEEEWEVIQKHPLSSVRQILRLHASHDLKSMILLAPFEHHIKHDLTGGYPKVHFKREVSLFGRILHIADVYDAITAPRIYRPSA